MNKVTAISYSLLIHFDPDDYTTIAAENVEDELDKLLTQLEKDRQIIMYNLRRVP